MTIQILGKFSFLSCGGSYVTKSFIIFFIDRKYRKLPQPAPYTFCFVLLQQKFKAHLTSSFFSALKIARIRPNGILEGSGSVIFSYSFFFQICLYKYFSNVTFQTTIACRTSVLEGLEEEITFSKLCVFNIHG